MSSSNKKYHALAIAYTKDVFGAEPTSDIVDKVAEVLESRMVEGIKGWMAPYFLYSLEKQVFGTSHNIRTSHNIPSGVLIERATQFAGPLIKPAPPDERQRV